MYFNPLPVASSFAQVVSAMWYGRHSCQALIYQPEYLLTAGVISPPFLSLTLYPILFLYSSFFIPLTLLLFL